MPLAPLGSITDSVAARDGVRLRLRRWAAPGRPHTFLVLIADAHEDTTAWEPWAMILQDAGVDIEGFDLRGRGGSEGSLSWPSLLDDLEDRIAAARERAAGGQVAVQALGVSAVLALDYALSERPKPDALSVWSPLRLLPSGVSFDDGSTGLKHSIRARFGGRTGSRRDWEEAVERVTAGAASIPIPTNLVVTMESLLSKLAIPAQAFRPLDFTGVNVGPDLHQTAQWRDHAHRMMWWLRAQAQERSPEALPQATGHTVNELLPRKEARALFREYVASEPGRLAAFERSVHERGGPRPACDRVSLAALGGWMIDALSEGESTGPEPRWASHWRHWDGPEGRLDTATMWLIDGLAAHLARCYRSIQPDLEWELDTYKSSVHFQEPLLGYLSVPGQARNVIRAARADPPDADWLGRIWDEHVKTVELLRARAQEPAGDEGDDDGPLPFAEITVEALEEPLKSLGLDLGIWIPEQTESAIGDAAFETLDSRIAALPGVLKLVWEDREVMYARLAPDHTPEHLRDAIVTLLRADVERQQAIDAAEDDGDD